MEIKRHDVVQINENHNWTGCFVYVTDVESWGIKGFVSMPSKGNAYVRLNWQQFNKIGEAIIQITDEENN